LILGLNAYDNNQRQYMPNTFAPIRSEMNGEQQHSESGTNLSTFNVSPHLLERPRTAPSFNEMYRPPSAVSVPELSKESLHSMLK
jgi:hypothetical protein